MFFLVGELIFLFVCVWWERGRRLFFVLGNDTQKIFWVTIQILHTTKSADCIHFYILFPKSTTVAQKSVDLALSIKSIDASMFLSYIDTKNLHGSHQRSDAISSDVVVKIKTKSSWEGVEKPSENGEKCILMQSVVLLTQRVPWSMLCTLWMVFLVNGITPSRQERRGDYVFRGETCPTIRLLGFYNPSQFGR